MLVLLMQLAHHPIFQRIASLGNSKVFTKGREMVEDVRERWETSDSAMVQRIQVQSQIADASR